MRRTFEGDAGDAPSTIGSEATLAIDGLDGTEVRVVALRGHERTNDLFRFAVAARIRGLSEAALRSAILGRGCHLELMREGEPRAIHGIGADVELRGHRDVDSFYLITIVPKLWLATKTVDSRVFHDATVQEIVTEILAEHGVVHAWSLARGYPRREHVLQYEESDYRFVTRLLAESGIFFVFEHPGSVEALRERLALGLPNALGSEVVQAAQSGFDLDSLKGAGKRLGQAAAWMQVAELQAVGELMVLADSASSYAADLPELAYRPELAEGAMRVDERHVHRFAVRSAIAPTRSTARGYDPERAQIPRHGTVIGTVAPGYQGAFADAVSASVEAIGDVTGEASNMLGPAAGITGPLAQASGFPVGEPGAALGRLNESWSHGIVTSTHAEMAPEVALARSAVMVAGAIGNQLLSATPLAGVAGEAAGGAANMFGGAEGGLEHYVHHQEYEEQEATFEAARTRLEQLRARHIECTAFTHCRLLSPGRRFRLSAHELSHLNRDYAVVEVVHELFAGEDAGVVYQNEMICIPADVPARPPPPPKRFHQAVETGVVVGAEGQEIATEHLGRVKVQFHWDRRGRHDDRSSCWIRVMQPWAGTGFGFQFIPRVGMEVLVSFVGGDMNRPVVVGCLPNLANPTPHHLPQEKARSGIRTRSTPGGDGHNELAFDDTRGHEAVFLRAQKNYEEDVRHNHILRVGHDQTIHIEGRREQEIKSDEVVRVRSHATREVHGNRVERTGGAAEYEYGQGRATSMVGDDSLRVGGARIMTVRGSDQVIVQRAAAGDPAVRSVIVQGSQYFSAAGDVRILAQGSIELVVGRSSLRLTDEEMVLRAPRITLQAEDGAVVRGGDDRVSLGEGVEVVGGDVALHSDGASVLLNSDARVNGARVLLNCSDDGPGGGDDSDNPDRGRVRFRVDPPEGFQGTLTFLIATPDGEVVERQADANHEVAIEGRPGDRYTLLDVRAGDESLGVDIPDEGEES